jgi:hypothetical protein
MRQTSGFVPIVDDTGVATWTVSRFHSGQSNAYACDRALQHCPLVTFLPLGRRLVIDQSCRPGATFGEKAAKQFLLGSVKRGCA